MTETYFDYVEKELKKNPELDKALKDYEVHQAIARLEELGKNGFRPPIQYTQVSDSLAWVRQDLDLVKKHIAMLENSITGVENPPKQNPTKPTHKPIKIGKSKI